MEVTREEATRMLVKVFSEFAPRIPLNVKNVMVLTTIVGTVMDFTAGNYEWQYDLDIGAKRFKDKRFGPWCKWKSIEA